MLEPVVVMPSRIWLLADNHSGEMLAFETKEAAIEFASDPDQGHPDNQFRWSDDDHAEWWTRYPSTVNEIGYLMAVEVVR